MLKWYISHPPVNKYRCSNRNIWFTSHMPGVLHNTIFHNKQPFKLDIIIVILKAGNLLKVFERFPRSLTPKHYLAPLMTLQ